MEPASNIARVACPALKKSMALVSDLIYTGKNNSNEQFFFLASIMEQFMTLSLIEKPRCKEKDRLYCMAFLSQRKEKPSTCCSELLLFLYNTAVAVV